MKLANNIYITVFRDETEDENEILEKLKGLMPFDIEEEKIKIEKRKHEKNEQKTIFVYQITLSKQRHTNAFIEKLIEELSEKAKDDLITQCRTRTDDDCNFFLRLDKEKFYDDSKCELTEKGSCFHIKMNLALFPKKKKKQENLLKKYLNRKRNKIYNGRY